MLSTTAPYNQKSSFVDGLLEIIRILGTWYEVNPDAAFSEMSASNYEHGNRSVAEDLLEEIIIRLGELSGPGGGGGSVDISGKLDKTTNVQSIDENGITDGMFAVFNPTANTIKGSGQTLSTNIGQDDPTNNFLWTVKAIKDYVTDQLASRVTVVPVFADPSATGWTYTNMLAAVGVYGGTDRHSFRLNTVKVRTIRIATTVLVPGAASANIYAEYSTDGVNYSKIGNGAGDNIILISSTGKKETGWMDLPIQAIGDVFFRIGCASGDGVADPVLGHTSMQFKTA